MQLHLFFALAALAGANTTTTADNTTTVGSNTTTAGSNTTTAGSNTTTAGSNTTPAASNTTTAAPTASNTTPTTTKSASNTTPTTTKSASKTTPTTTKSPGSTTTKASNSTGNAGNTTTSKPKTAITKSIEVKVSSTATMDAPSNATAKAALITALNDLAVQKENCDQYMALLDEKVAATLGKAACGCAVAEKTTRARQLATKMTLQYDYTFAFPAAAQEELSRDTDMANSFVEIVQGTMKQPTAEQMKAVVSKGFDKAKTVDTSVTAIVDEAKKTIVAEVPKVDEESKKANADALATFNKRAQEEGSITPAATSFAAAALSLSFTYVLTFLAL